MITYSQLTKKHARAGKDDVAFHRVARKVLGSEYGNACQDANETFITGYNSGSVTSRENLARRSANLVILKLLRDYGVTDWTNIDAPQPKRKPVNNARQSFVSQKVKDRKFNSDCQLWSKKL